MTDTKPCPSVAPDLQQLLDRMAIRSRIAQEATSLGESEGDQPSSSQHEEWPVVDEIWLPGAPEPECPDYSPESAGTREEVEAGVVEATAETEDLHPESETASLTAYEEWLGPETNAPEEPGSQAVWQEVEQQEEMAASWQPKPEVELEQADAEVWMEAEPLAEEEPEADAEAVEDASSYEEHGEAAELVEGESPEAEAEPPPAGQLQGAEPVYESVEPAWPELRVSEDVWAPSDAEQRAAAQDWQAERSERQEVAGPIYRQGPREAETLPPELTPETQDSESPGARPQPAPARGALPPSPLVERRGPGPDAGRRRAAPPARPNWRRTIVLGIILLIGVALLIRVLAGLPLLPGSTSPSSPKPAIVPASQPSSRPGAGAPATAPAAQPTAAAAEQSVTPSSSVQTYRTVNGPKSIDQIRSELEASGYPFAGDTNPPDLVNAYNTTARGQSAPLPPAFAANAPPGAQPGSAPASWQDPAPSGSWRGRTGQEIRSDFLGAAGGPGHETLAQASWNQEHSTEARMNGF